MAKSIQPRQFNASIWAPKNIRCFPGLPQCFFTTNGDSSQVIDSDNQMETVFKTIIQRREDVGILFENLRVSSLARVFEIVDFRKQLEGTVGRGAVITRNTLTAMYQKIKFSKYSEEVSSTFIEYSLNFHKTVLCDQEIVNVLLRFDQLPLNPIDSLYKMREIAVQVERKPANLKWVLTLLFDHWTRLDSKDPIPIRHLKESEDRDHVSLVKLFMMKRHLRDHLWKQMEVGYAWDSKIKVEIRRLTEDVCTIRKELGFYDDAEEQKVLDARATWPSSADAFLMLFESLVFGYKLDGAFYATLRNRKGVEDLLQHKSLKYLSLSLAKPLIFHFLPQHCLGALSLSSPEKLLVLAPVPRNFCGRWCCLAGRFWACVCWL